MKCSVIYSSEGNTKLLAEKVKEFIKDEDIVYFGPTDDKALECERVYIGFWTNQGVCDQVTKEFLKKLTTQEIFLFGSAGFGMSEEYFTEIINRSKEFIPETVKLIGHFMCQGKMPMSVKERYLKMKEEKKNIPNLDMLIENFDMALSHPDEKDFDKLKASLAK